MYCLCFRVRTGFHIVNPEVEAAQARLEAMRTGRYMPVNNKKKKGKSESTSRGTSLGNIFYRSSFQCIFDYRSDG